MSQTIGKDYIKKIKPYKPGKPSEELKRELGLDSIYKLASNENVIAPSAKVLAAISKAMRSINRYPDGGGYYLKRDLAKKHKLSQKNIVLGNGSDELIMLAIKSIVCKGENIVTADPTFLMYKISAQIEGVRAICVPLKNYRYDLNAMLKAVNKKTRIVFIANPDNPTGSYISEKELNSFLRKLPKHIMVFLDEAYYEYANYSDYPRSIKYLKGKRPFIITRTFSKIYSIAGLRIGYGLMASQTADLINKVRDPFNVNQLAQEAARASLKDPSHVKKTMKLIREGRKYLYHSFDKMGLPYVKSATNFILFQIKKDPTTVYNQLLEKGVIVRDVSSWGLKNSLRVTLGTMKENKIFIKYLKEALR